MTPLGVFPIDKKTGKPKTYETMTEEEILDFEGADDDEDIPNLRLPASMQRDVEQHKRELAKDHTRKLALGLKFKKELAKSA